MYTEFLFGCDLQQHHRQLDQLSWPRKYCEKSKSYWAIRQVTSTTISCVENCQLSMLCCMRHYHWDKYGLSYYENPYLSHCCCSFISFDLIVRLLWKWRRCGTNVVPCICVCVNHLKCNASFGCPLAWCLAHPSCPLLVHSASLLIHLGVVM